MFCEYQRDLRENIRLPSEVLSPEKQYKQSKKPKKGIRLFALRLLLIVIRASSDK
jgi:hypothetical protein